jgi:hypothetical protein
MPAFPTSFRIAQAVGLTGAAWLSGVLSHPLNFPSSLISTLDQGRETQKVVFNHHHVSFTDFLPGNIASLSLISIPALTKSQDSIPPRILAKQWNDLYDLGRTQNPPIAGVTAASFSYLAWSVRPGTSLRLLAPRNAMQLYAAAAVFTLGIVPYTLLTMNSTNNKLIVKAGKVDVNGKGLEGTGDNKEVGELLRKWQGLNGIRSVIPLLGVVAGFMAVLG